MAASDWSRFVPVDLTLFVQIVHQIGFYGFVLGTVLAVWSGVRYVIQHRTVVFSDADGANSRNGS
jgi:hypothetical protein